MQLKNIIESFREGEYIHHLKSKYKHMKEIFTTFDKVQDTLLKNLLDK